MVIIFNYSEESVQGILKSQNSVKKRTLCMHEAVIRPITCLWSVFRQFRIVSHQLNHKGSRCHS